MAVRLPFLLKKKKPLSFSTSLIKGLRVIIQNLSQVKYFYKTFIAGIIAYNEQKRNQVINVCGSNGVYYKLYIWFLN